MAVNLTDGFEKLVKTILLGEVGFHQDFKKVNRLANLYQRLITGEDSGKLLKKFTPREDDALFAQRIRLTQLLTPAISEKIMQPFYKVSRIDNIKKSITFPNEESKDVEDKIEAVKNVLDNFHGDEGLDDFMETTFVDLVFTDPNSFIVTEFENFDFDNNDKASPFPFLVNSKEAVNYKYKNNVLQFLIVRKPHRFKSEDDKKGNITNDGHKYRLYLENEVILLVQVDPKLGGVESGKFELSNIKESPRIKINEKVFTVQVNEMKSKQVPAIRVGYKRDISTKGRTMVSPLQPAVPRMMKSVKAVSELDLTTTLHTFPQKLQYVQACKGKPNDICRGGKNAKDEPCKSCGGSGLAVHKSSGDVITFPMPDDAKEMLDLDKLLIYKNPPVDLIKWQAEYVTQLEVEALGDVFVSSSLRQTTKTQTATELDYDMENIYDTLFPFAKRFSIVYKKIAKLSAIFIDQSSVKIIHTFPKDFKLKTEKALIQDRKNAKDAGAPPFLLIEIDNDIANKVYGDDLLKLREYRVKQQHVPFSGKTIEEINLSINLGLTTKFDKTLWANFDSIMQEIDQQEMKESRDFYFMSYDVRAELIEKKVIEYNQRIESERGSAEMFNTVEDIPGEGGEGGEGGDGE